MDTEQQVAKHYSHGALENAILDALKASGTKIDRLATSDLAGVDEFHLGWRAATVEIAKDLGLSSAMHVLDVGSGIGGPRAISPKRMAPKSRASISPMSSFRSPM